MDGVLRTMPILMMVILMENKEENDHVLMIVVTTVIYFSATNDPSLLANTTPRVLTEARVPWWKKVYRFPSW